MSLDDFVAAGVFGPVEVHTVDLLARCVAARPAGSPIEHGVALAAALAVWAPLHGHVCVDLARIAELVGAELAIAADRRITADGASVVAGASGSGLSWPELGEWLDGLRRSPLVRAVTVADAAPVLDDRPLVLAGTRLYTQRQWTDECSVASMIRQRVGVVSTTPVPAVTNVLDALFGDPSSAPDQQRRAVESALSQPLTIVAGGPGTGKTFVVGRLLAALMQLDPDIRIGLAAPTGKAAARMTEAVAEAAAGQPLDGAGRLAELKAVTVHRLLGPDHRRTRFRHDAANRLPYDVVVIDEMSMVSLPLAARLFEALDPAARLVLVGDPDQLASVEAGTVLGDLVAAAASPASPLSRSVIRLDRQRRTSVNSPIFTLAEAIREGRADDVIELLAAGAVAPDGEPLVVFHDERGELLTPSDASSGAHLVVHDIVGPALFDMQAAAMAGQAAPALAALSSQRVLCAHRRGPYGVEQWNHTLEDWMVGAPTRHDHPGRAVLATRNDVRTGISNGDTGVLVARGRELRAVFGGSTREGGFARAELDQLDLAYALTVHKSQGSEYDTVVLVHPPADSPLVSRELLYTAVTRARRRLVVIGTPEAIAAAVRTPSRRVTGLRDALT